MLRSTRGVIHSGDAHRSISCMGRLVRAFDPASRRPGPGRTGAHQPCDPTPSRRRRERWGEPVAAEPGAGSGWQKPAGHRGLGASEWVGRPHRAVAERAAAPLGGIPGRASSHRLLAGQSPGRPLLWSGRCLRIADGSSLSQPGSKGTDWRLHGVYDLGRGGFSHLELTDRHGAESLLRCEPVAGEVLIADRGYARANELRRCLAPSGTGRATLSCGSVGKRWLCAMPRAIRSI